MTVISDTKTRRAGHRDRPAVSKLWAAAGLDLADDDEWQALTHGAATKLLVSHFGDELIGTVVVAFDGWRAYIYHLAVAESQRGKGIGLALMEEAEADLASQGARRIYIEVGEDNAAGLALCLARGFLREGDISLVKELRA